MGFIENLTEVTGTQEVDGVVQLVDRVIVGRPKYVNSGVGLRRELDRGTLDFEFSYNLGGDSAPDYFRQGQRFNPTHLNMPANCLDQGPHGHPGGEFSYVIEGEYFDGDMEGKVVRVYPAGSTVFYRQGSSHRPLSRDGANILYIPFDGIVFGKSAEDLARKMVKIGTAEEAVEYALMWMIPDKAERQRLMDDFTRQ